MATDIHPTSFLSVTLEGEHLDSGEDTDDQFHQAYLDFHLDSLKGSSLRLGQMEFSRGKERMLSRRYFSINGLAWRGALLQIPVGSWKADFFQFEPAPNKGWEHADDGLGGVYATGYFQDMPVDIYGLFRTQGNLDLSDTTVGILLQSSPPSASGEWNWNLETAFQTGDMTTGSSGGLALAALSEWKLGYVTWLGLGLDYAAGPSSGGSGFQPLYNSWFYDLGHSGIVNWSNLLDLSLRLRTRASDSGFWSAGVHFLNKAASGPASLLPGAENPHEPLPQDETEKYIGTEMDLVFHHTFETKTKTKLLLGLSHFNPGPALPGSDSQSWLWLNFGFGYQP
jgi:hypothetical protein